MKGWLWRGLKGTDPGKAATVTTPPMQPVRPKYADKMIAKAVKPKRGK